MSLLKPENIKAFVEANPKLVTRRESTRYPGLYVLKYTRKVFYDALWTEELMEMRGLVLDVDYNIVSYPFTKIFNRGEAGTDFHRDTWVDAVRKVNGFMACVAKYNGRNIVSTTGSLDSDFVKIAEKWIGHLQIMPEFTYMFEICDPTDPHIIKEDSGAYLIGMRNLRTHQLMREDQLDVECPILNHNLMNNLIKRPRWYRCNFSTAVDLAHCAKHEGFVCRDYVSGKDLKLKSPYYLTTKFLARMRYEKLIEKFADVKNLKQTIDEEFYGLVDHIAKHFDTFQQLDEQNRIRLIENYFLIHGSHHA